MRNMLCLFVLLAGCAEEPKIWAPAAPATQTLDTRDSTAKELLLCMHGAARELDDGRSDPRAIAYAVRGQCASEGRRYYETFVVGEPLEFRSRFLREAEVKQLDAATAAVLRERRRR